MDRYTPRDAERRRHDAARYSERRQALRRLEQQEAEEVDVVTQHATDKEDSHSNSKGQRQFDAVTQKDRWYRRSEQRVHGERLPDNARDGDAESSSTPNTNKQSEVFFNVLYGLLLLSVNLRHPRTCSGLLAEDNGLNNVPGTAASPILFYQ